MIISKIHIPENGIISDKQSDFLAEKMFVDLPTDDRLRLYFKQFFHGRTVFGNLVRVDGPTSFDAIYNIFFQKENMLFNIGYVPPLFGSFLFQEHNHEYFPHNGNIWTLTKNPLPGIGSGSGEVFCFKKPGDHQWTVSWPKKDMKKVSTGDHVFFITRDEHEGF